jgi:hypothetical protein
MSCILIIQTTKTTIALMLKLYFFTQSVITPKCFDLLWSSSGSYTFWQPKHKLDILLIWTTVKKHLKLQIPHLINQLFTAQMNFVISTDTLWTNFNIAVYSMAKRNFALRLQTEFQLSNDTNIFSLFNGDEVFFFEVVTTCSYSVQVSFIFERLH